MNKIQKNLRDNNQNQTLTESDNLYNSILNTIQMIEIKFANGQDYSIELDLLNNILGSDDIYIIEKLYLLNNKRFIGNKKLIINFQNEMDKYISDNFLSVNKVIKRILPYIKIEPSQKNKLFDNRLIIINNTLIQIENKNYSKSLDLINLIDKDKKFFNLTREQLSIAVKFNKTIKNIIKND